MIKLMVIISSFEVGGVSSVAKNLLDSLDRGKFQIVFLAESVRARHYPIPEDVKVINLDISPRSGVLNKFLNFISHIRRFRRAVINENPGLVFSLSYNMSCYLLFKPDKALKGKILIGEFSENFFVRPLKSSIKQVMLRVFYKMVMLFSYRRAERIIVVSKSIGRQLKKSFALKDDKIRVIPTPVNLSRIRESLKEAVLDYKFHEGCIYISFLSRLSPEKGIKYLLLAFSRLRKECHSKLIIIGEGYSRLELEELSLSLGIQEDVSFLGFKDNPFKYLAKTDIFVLSSLYEGFPNVILESYACGVPVIATRCVAGIEELINDGKNGILVNPADEDSLYKAMLRVAGDNELRARLKDEGVRSVKAFDLPLKIKDYEDLFLQTSIKN